MILNYDSFLENLILSQINEAILYYSSDFKKVLNTMRDSEIASDLLNAEATDVKPDTTFIDLDKDGYLSFITSGNAIKLIDAKWPDGGISPILKDKPNGRLAELIWQADKIGGNDSSGVSTKSRNLIKIGKLVNKIFPEKYKDKDIEEFVNKFKASIENTKEKFIIVEGEDIDHWYDSSNYYEISGTLGNSCMKGKSGRGYFDIYTKNPEVCRMLILVEGGKLKGRALVWKVDNNRGFTYYLDRQYTINESDVNKFRKYADDNDWAYKTYNNHSELQAVTYKGENKYTQMTVHLKYANEDRKSYNYSEYPYVDTFRRYDPKRGILYNDSEQASDYDGQSTSEDTAGGYTQIQGGKWSEYYGEYVDEDRAVWSEPMDSYLDIDESVEIRRGSRRNRGWWPRDHNDIFYDEYHDDYIHADDSIHSVYYGHDILEDDSVIVIRKIDKHLNTTDDAVYSDDNCYVPNSRLEDELWFKKLSKKIDTDFIYGVLENCLEKSSDNKWIPESLSIDVFKTLSDEYEIEYLTIIDAYILGVDVDKSKKYKTIDMVSYDTYLYKNNIYKLLTSKASAISNKKQTTMFDEVDPNQKMAMESRYRNVVNRWAELEEFKYVYID